MYAEATDPPDHWSRQRPATGVGWRSWGLNQTYDFAMNCNLDPVALWSTLRVAQNTYDEHDDESVNAAKVRLIDMLAAAPMADLWEDGSEKAADLSSASPVRVYSGGDLLDAELPTRNPIIVNGSGDPIIRERDHILWYGPRGFGKSWSAQGLAVALSEGTNWARWKATRSCRVVCVDGEMPAGAIKGRYRKLLAGERPSGNLTFIMADVQDRPLPSLASIEGQELLEPYIRDAEVLFLDHLSALFGRMAENDAEAWAPAQDWLLSLRRRGITVFLVHHAGRSGQQRGTTKREDIADLIVSLKQPGDYVPEQGLRAEIHMEKARGLLGAATEPFEVQLRVVDDVAIWQSREPEAEAFSKVVELLREGKSLRAIEGITGISKSKAQRWRSRAKGKGLL